MMHTGWGSRYPDPRKVFNTMYPEDPKTYHFPGLCGFKWPRERDGRTEAGKGGGRGERRGTRRLTGSQVDGQVGEGRDSQVDGQIGERRDSQVDGQVGEWRDR